MITLIPSSREMARSGLRARNVRRERNTDKLLSAKRQASEICEESIETNIISNVLIQTLCIPSYSVVKS